MSALAERLTPRPTRCKYGDLVARHADTEDLAVLNNPATAHIDIASAVTELWGPVSVHVVGRHRTGRCCCPKDDPPLNLGLRGGF